MKTPHIKNKDIFNKVARNYGFVRINEDSIYKMWYRSSGPIEIRIFDLSSRISIIKNGITMLKGKRLLQKYIKDFSIFVEWR